MIELRDCIVGVKDEKEYEKITQIAKSKDVSGILETLQIIFTVHFLEHCFLIKKVRSRLDYTMEIFVTIIVKI